MTRKILKTSFALFAGWIAVTGSPGLYGRQNEVQLMPVSGNVWMLVGAGGNIAVSVGRDGVLLVDTGSAAMADKVLETVNKLAVAVNSSPMPVTPCVGLRCKEFQSPHGWSSPAINEIITSPAPPQP